MIIWIIQWFKYFICFAIIIKKYNYQRKMKCNRYYRKKCEEQSSSRFKNMQITTVSFSHSKLVGIPLWCNIKKTARLICWPWNPNTFLKNKGKKKENRILQDWDAGKNLKNISRFGFVSTAWRDPSRFRCHNIKDQKLGNVNQVTFYPFRSS